MQRLAELCIRLPVFASMIVLFLVVVGAVAYFRADIVTLKFANTDPAIIGNSVRLDRARGSGGRRRGCSC